MFEEFRYAVMVPHQSGKDASRILLPAVGLARLLEAFGPGIDCL